jgi:4-amino-4-deoxy-L-arabinose transferase-like glycosyltransferase
MFFTTLSLFAFWLGFQGTGPARRWLWVFYVAMAVGTLAKGPVGFLVPGITVLLYLALTSAWRRFWARGYPLAGTALLIALAAPWYLAMWTIHGPEYVTIAQAHTVGRFLSPMEGHSFTILFYVPVLLLGFFPWSGWLPFAWYAAYRSWREARSAAPSPVTRHTSHDQDSLDWFAAAWVLGVFVFFTLSSTRLPHYIGPLFPGAAILTACYWHRGLSDPETKGIRASIHTMMAIGYLLAIGFASLPSIYPSIAGKLVKEFPLATEFNFGTGPYLVSVVLLVGMALVGFLGLNERRRAGAFWAAGASLGAMVIIVLQLILPGINRYFIAPPQELAYAAGLNLDPQDRFIVYGSTRPSMVFYARRKAIFVAGNEQDLLKSYLNQPGRTMILLPETYKSFLPEEAQAYQVILKRFGYQLLANQPMVTIPEGVAPPPAARIPGH